MQGGSNFKITREIKLRKQWDISILLKISYFGKHHGSGYVHTLSVGVKIETLLF